MFEWIAHCLGRGPWRFPQNGVQGWWGFIHDSTLILHHMISYDMMILLSKFLIMSRRLSIIELPSLTWTCSPSSIRQSESGGWGSSIRQSDCISRDLTKMTSDLTTRFKSEGFKANKHLVHCHMPIRAAATLKNSPQVRGGGGVSLKWQGGWQFYKTIPLKK